MIVIERFRDEHLPQLTSLVNLHLGALAPGWAVPAPVLAALLVRNPGEYVVDPWVRERATLCALEGGRLVAAAHLLRYGEAAEVGQAYRAAAEINWLYSLPANSEAAERLLTVAEQQIGVWQPSAVWFEGGALLGPFAGIPDTWPHLAALLAAAGYQPDPAQDEAVFGGWLGDLPARLAPPLRDLDVQRSAGVFGVRFTAVLAGQAIGACECIADMTQGGALPALQGWAQLSEFAVDAEWRNRGVGMWLMQQAVAWLRLAGCNRVVLSVAADDEAAGAGRFYERCGWHPLVRSRRGWRRVAPVR